MAGQQAGQQAGRRAGVAHIQHIIRLAEFANAQTIHTPVPRRVLHDLCPQCPHGGCGAQNILPFQQPGNMGFAPCEGRKHERTVANGFIARHTDGTGKGSLRARNPQRTGRGGRCVCHALFIPAGWTASQSVTGRK